MIRERLHSAIIRAISFDKMTSAIKVEFTSGAIAVHAPVPYETYHTVASSRFPEKIYRHLLDSNVLPVAG